jgi:hypothetical protein
MTHIEIAQEKAQQYFNTHADNTIKSILDDVVANTIADNNASILEKLLAYLSEEHMHFDFKVRRPFPFEQGAPYVHSMDMEKYLKEFLTPEDTTSDKKSV